MPEFQCSWHLLAAQAARARLEPRAVVEVLALVQVEGQRELGARRLVSLLLRVAHAAATSRAAGARDLRALLAGVLITGPTAWSMCLVTTLHGGRVPVLSVHRPPFVHTRDLRSWWHFSMGWITLSGGCGTP